MASVSSAAQLEGVESPPRIASWSRSFLTAQAVLWSTFVCIVATPIFLYSAELKVRPWDALPTVVSLALSGLLVTTLLAAVYGRMPETWLRGVSTLAAVGGAVVAGAVLWVALIHGIELLIGIAPPRPRGPPRSLLPVILLAWATVLLGAWSAGYLAFSYHKQAVSARQRARDVAVLAQGAKLQLLESQLHPHFLFNALNSVIALIDENPSRAEEMIRDLAALLRRALEPNR